MTEFVAEHITVVCAMFAWIMGYAVGYTHGMKDGDNHDEP